MADQAQEIIVPLVNGSDPVATMSVLWQGPPDAQMRIRGSTIERASRFPAGAATLQLDVARDHVVARAWGPGARAALDVVPALIGERDDPTALLARHDVVAQARRRLPGLRMTSGTPLFETLLFSILGQKVTSFEARRSFGALVRRFGEPAPGPLGLLVPPPAAKLARTPYWAFHGLGIERRRAEAIRAAAAAAHRLPGLVPLPTDERIARLSSLPGIGPWTAAEAVRMSLGDPDAVSVGDYHLPSLVCWALASEREGSDERMLELLEPYAGQRARVVLLIERAALRFERHRPRMAPRSIAAI
jgi:3-methyladenine DNA glycosylase/8-oxoguanine DNA glycosylase